MQYDIYVQKDLKLVSLFLQIIDADQILGLVRGSNAPSYTGLSGRPFYR
jgi:hypothetical protein